MYNVCIQWQGKQHNSRTPKDLIRSRRENHIVIHSVIQTIVNKGEWLWSPANIKGANKNAKIYVGRSTTVHNLLFCPHTLCMNYVTNTFLLVSSSVRSKQLLCLVHGQGQKGEQKHTTKNIVGFHNHSPLLTMFKLNSAIHVWTKLKNVTFIIWETSFFSMLFLEVRFKSCQVSIQFPYVLINLEEIRNTLVLGIQHPKND